MAGGSVCVMRQISSNKTEGSNYRIWKRSTGQRRQCGCFKNISSIVTGLLQLYFSSLFSFCCIFVRFIPFLSYSISIFVSTRGRRTVKHQTERTEKRPKNDKRRLQSDQRLSAVTFVTPGVCVVGVQVNDAREIVVEQFNFGILLQSVFSDRLECLFNVQWFFGRCFKIRYVVLRHTPALSAFYRDLLCSLRVRQRKSTLDMKLTARFSRSTLFPITMKGKFSGSRGLAWIRNSSRHASSDLNELGAVTS